MFARLVSFLTLAATVISVGIGAFILILMLDQARKDERRYPSDAWSKVYDLAVKARELDSGKSAVTKRRKSNLRRCSGTRQQLSARVGLIKRLESLVSDGVSLQSIYLPSVNMYRKNAKSGVNLSGANLAYADLGESNLQKAKLSGATLKNARLDRSCMKDADFTDADMTNADIYKSDLSRANLSGAMLTNADLSRTDLSRANLSGAILVNADLSEADLSRANLSGAILVNADLSEADLSGVRGITQIQLDDACAFDKPPIDVPKQFLWKIKECN